MVDESVVVVDVFALQVVSWCFFFCFFVVDSFDGILVMLLERFLFLVMCVVRSLVLVVRVARSLVLIRRFVPSFLVLDGHSCPSVVFFGVFFVVFIFFFVVVDGIVCLFFVLCVLVVDIVWFLFFLFYFFILWFVILYRSFKNMGWSSSEGMFLKFFVNVLDKGVIWTPGEMEIGSLEVVGLFGEGKLMYAGDDGGGYGEFGSTALGETFSSG